MKHARILSVSLLIFASACGDDNPAGPSIIASPPTSQILTGPLEPAATAGFFFVVAEPAQVRVSLASLGLNPDGSAVSVNMTLVFGTPVGTDCTPQTSTGASPALTAHIVRVVDTPGTYCVAVTDPGNLQKAAELAIHVRIVPFTAPSSTISTAGTDTFTTNLSAGGWMSRSVRTSQPGTITLRLESASPPDNIVLGLGVGVPRSDGTGCLLTQAVNRSPGGSPQISLQADAGIFCARVYDVGNITTPITFTASIVKP
jgi:hypothetical protein